MRTFLALIGTLVCLTGTLSAQSSIPLGDDMSQILGQTRRLEAILEKGDQPIWGDILEFDSALTEPEFRSNVVTLVQSTLEPFPPQEDGKYNLSIGLRAAAPRNDGGVEYVPLTGKNLEFTVTGGKPPQTVYDFNAYALPTGPANFYFPIKAPGVTWATIEEVRSRSVVVDTVNGSWPPGCWIQTDLAGNGYVYPPTFLLAKDGVDRTMTWYYNDARSLWRRYSLSTGLVVAESNPPPTTPRPLSLTIALKDGKREITISGDGAQDATIEESTDLVHWGPPLSVVFPPTLSSTSERKHSLATGGGNRFYRARQSVSSQKQ